MAHKGCRDLVFKVEILPLLYNNSERQNGFKITKVSPTYGIPFEKCSGSLEIRREELFRVGEQAVLCLSGDGNMLRDMDLSNILC